MSDAFRAAHAIAAGVVYGMVNTKFTVIDNIHDFTRAKEAATRQRNAATVIALITEADRAVYSAVNH